MPDTVRGVNIHRTHAGAIIATAVLASLPGCARFSGFENLTGVEACDPASTTFSVSIDNPFFPLPVGHRVVLEGEEGGQHLLVRITALDEKEVVDGVETRVVEEYEAKSGQVVEISRNFFAQAEDGTVCYFGEEVDIYDEDGDITSHAGAWRAGGEKVPGIFMPASPQIGQAFQQEIAPGVAEDQAKVVALGEETVVPAGTFDDTVTMVDRNPLDGSEDTKVYARGVGLIVDEAAQMTKFTPAA